MQNSIERNVYAGRPLYNTQRDNKASQIIALCMPVWVKVPHMKKKKVCGKQSVFSWKLLG